MSLCSKSMLLSIGQLGINIDGKSNVKRADVWKEVGCVCVDPHLPRDIADGRARGR